MYFISVLRVGSTNHTNKENSMERYIGKSKVSAMGMGCWAIGGPFFWEDTPLGWGDVDDKESIAAIHSCLDHGVNFFDTANIYGAGHSEVVLGKALKGKRDQVFIATKFGSIFNEDTKMVTGGSAEPADIRSQTEDSLRRLDMDYIDLMLFHFNDHPADESLAVRETLEDLVKEGKIRSYGWSTDFADRVQAFAEGEHCIATEFQMNVIQDNAEVMDLVEKYNQAGIARGPLAMGLLSGKYKRDTQLGDNDVRGTKSPDWMTLFTDGKPNSAEMDKIDAVREILSSGGRSLVQGALAWHWGRSDKLIPIPGIRTVKQAEENCAAMDFGPLSKSQISEIDSILGR
jgi:aryl-alcohol dehydrogenase-like predicted oxidoreductase